MVSGGVGRGVLGATTARRAVSDGRRQSARPERPPRPASTPSRWCASARTAAPSSCSSRCPSATPASPSRRTAFALDSGHGPIAPLSSTPFPPARSTVAVVLDNRAVIPPSDLLTAQVAAVELLRGLEDGTPFAVVTTARAPALQGPTTDKDAASEAIRSVAPSGGGSLSDGVSAALDSVGQRRGRACAGALHGRRAGRRAGAVGAGRGGGSGADGARRHRRPARGAAPGRRRAHRDADRAPAPHLPGLGPRPGHPLALPGRLPLRGRRRPAARRVIAVRHATRHPRARHRPRRTRRRRACVRPRPRRPRRCDLPPPSGSTGSDGETAHGRCSSPSPRRWQRSPSWAPGSPSTGGSGGPAGGARSARSAPSRTAGRTRRCRGWPAEPMRVEPAEPAVAVESGVRSRTTTGRAARVPESVEPAAGGSAVAGSTRRRAGRGTAAGSAGASRT